MALARHRSLADALLSMHQTGFAYRGKQRGTVAGLGPTRDLGLQLAILDEVERWRGPRVEQRPFAFTVGAHHGLCQMLLIPILERLDVKPRVLRCEPVGRPLEQFAQHRIMLDGLRRVLREVAQRVGDHDDTEAAAEHGVALSQRVSCEIYCQHSWTVVADVFALLDGRQIRDLQLRVFNEKRARLVELTLLDIDLVHTFVGVGSSRAALFKCSKITRHWREVFAVHAEIRHLGGDEVDLLQVIGRNRFDGFGRL